MNISEFDLNLLAVFDALFTERSVTKASRRLGLSQPALSHALKKLRELLEDELFVRTGRVMVPTPRALDLAVAIRPALEQLRGALAPGSAASVAAEVSGTVTLGMDDYLQAFLLPGLVARIERRTPGVLLNVRGPGSRRRLPLLREGRLDLAIGTSDIVAHRDFRAARLFEDRYVCMVRKGLAGGADRLSAALFSVLNHVVASGGDSERQGVDREVLRAPVTRRVSVQLSGSFPIPWVVATSDAVGLVPLRLGKWCAGVLPVDLLELPMPLPPAVVSVRWHRRAEQSQAIMRVRDELVQVGQELG